MPKTSSTKTKKTPSKNRKGRKYECRVCGLSVTVDRDCGCGEAHELICCDSVMLPGK
jgi:hypothetical protein